ncbi:MAG: two-component system response regulator HydG [Gammaproteobacteria bacterium]|jgi:two-component system response regulator HydG
MATILIVDDDDLFTSGIAEFLRLHGHEVTTVRTLAQGRRSLSIHEPTVVVLDLMLPDGNGLELLQELAEYPNLRVVISTGNSGVKSFIGQLEGDNVSFLVKPIDPRELIAIVNAVGSTDTVDDEEPTKTGAHFGLIVGESPQMHAIYQQIRQVGPLQCTVFVRGESGTGKELIAESVHRISGRGGPYIPVNCGGLSKDLVASELFGHEKGSFTGAAKRHVGFFERANDGTLFLDEITEMPIELQTQLLRVLETESITRVGGEQELPITARLIAATNRDPMEAIAAGKLREDLFFRLQVFPISLPPLRERIGDVALLAKHLTKEFSKKYKTKKALGEGALETIGNATWPGNVRELKHAIHRAFVMAPGETIEDLQVDDFSAAMEARNHQPRIGQSIADMERDLINATLEHFAGDKKAAAATLGVSLKTLYNRINEYKIGSDE